MAEFLFEIGFEEMPAPWLSGLAEQLQAKFLAVAGDEQLAPADVRVLWTSRRLVLVAGVKARQDDRTVVEWGPAAKIAKDPAGNWSKAAEGFAKKQGVPLDALKLASKAEGSADLHVSATKQIAGRPTGEVLASLLPAVLRGFNFPKRMNWDAWLDDGRGAFEFGRPIQWLVALLDGDVVPVTIFEAVGGAKGVPRVVSGRRSAGNRFYPRGTSKRGFDVRKFADLEAGLASRFVILDPAKRAERIRAQVVAAGGEVTGEAAHLLDEWSDLVEYPKVVVGSIPKEFGDLPDEVLETVLAHHQKAVPLPRAADGSPRFAAISGGDEAAAINAARGQERVVIARLKDARFFYNEDRKRPLADRVDDLAAVTFQRGLGSYKDKAERMERVAADEAALAVLADEAAAWRVARRALRLCKADLTTQMVREFPELQGRMGANYANASEGSSVATAIAHHYEVEPVSVADRISSLAVLNTSLVDKLDTLIGYFRIGSIPTGSADPFGLRRAAQGVVRALLQAPPGSVKLTRLSNRLNEEFARQTGETGNADALPRLGDFLVERLRHALQANGHNARAVDAVLSARERASLSTGTNQALDNATLVENDVTETEALIAQQPADFAALAESFKRAKNIVADAETGDVNESLLSEAAERDLLAAIQKAESSPASDPAARLRAVAGLRGEVDTFFKSVMVMAEDPALKANRLALLSRLLNLVYEVADLSKLASPAGEKAVSS